MANMVWFGYLEKRYHTCVYDSNIGFFMGLDATYIQNIDSEAYVLPKILCSEQYLQAKNQQCEVPSMVVKSHG